MPGRFCYDYPRPQVTVDLVVFTYRDRVLQTLLVRRRHDPFAGKWAIPGGFLDLDEPEEAGARRELKEETGLELSGPVEPIGFFGKPGRDPRGRTITLAHAAVARPGEQQIRGGDDADEAAWFPLDAPVELAFDHGQILQAARRWLDRRLQAPHGTLEILPSTFELDDVLAVFRPLPCGPNTAFAWLADRLGRGQIVVDPQPSGVFHVAGPAR
jgi:8-oxo-dGTP diphosphatase